MWGRRYATRIDQVSPIWNVRAGGDEYKRSHLVARDAANIPLQCAWVDWPTPRSLEQIDQICQKILMGFQ